MKCSHNKKFYNFKEIHKRKKRIKSTERWWKSGSSIYTQIKRQEYRTKCKVILQKRMNNELIEFPLYKKTMWWDS